MLKKFIESKNLDKKIPEIIDDLVKHIKEDSSLHHINKYPIPSKKVIINILHNIINLIFPGYFTDKEINYINLSSYVSILVNDIFENLSMEIAKSFKHNHVKDNEVCDICNECVEKGIDVTLYLIESIPELRKILTLDVKAAYEGDPAAKSYNEIIFSYPGLFAITVHRIAHILYEKDIPLIPRIMSEYAHSLTGIDIHPGAKIGKSFFIDHGTGVVIGETCIIGDNVKIYQGVTLGGKSFPKDQNGNIIRGQKRHPTIEDNVTIYAGATILGGETVIGKNSIIGGNVWITESIPPNSKVTLSENLTKMDIKTKKV
ncbi:MAG TPA: serine acetyltransferase [Spirochaetota bacterium]|nr:serine acetyltransferase [Spirochaetota bacterium]HOL58072.1 serine acetyltransferase [Spirochaetota bacterium]HPP03673.1 serine acetyltransferase [Spirochaetota bacterium]